MKNKPIVKGSKLKVVSLFSGGGGLDLGLEAAGFETVFASDIDEHSCISLQENKRRLNGQGIDFLSNAFIHKGDVIDLEPGFILSSTGLKKGEVDLLAGGPPCQSFSVFGRRKGTDDPRGMLAYQYLRILSELEPRAFVFENVYGLMTIDGGSVFKELCDKLGSPKEGLRYTLSVFRVNSADYGVPQFRDRIFVIGSKEGKKIDIIPPICKEGFSNGEFLPYRTVADAFKGLPPMGLSLANHTGRKHSDRIIERYASLVYGERDPKTRINKLHPDKPSYTIIVGSDKGGGKGHVHPFEPREVTPRESARIQTFPDWWEFSGTSRHPIRQVGNAVPPLLSALIAREIAQTLFSAPRVSMRHIIDTLALQHLFSEDVDGI